MANKVNEKLDSVASKQYITIYHSTFTFLFGLFETKTKRRFLSGFLHLGLLMI